MDENQTRPELSKAEPNQHIILEQYKLYMEMLDRNTKRRLETNTLFISINVFIVTITSLFNKGNPLVLGLVCFAGILFSLVWYFLLVNYNVINAAKWDVLYNMEKLLPYDPFHKEWDSPDGVTYKPQNPESLLSFCKGFFNDLVSLCCDKGKNAKNYHSISELERNLPRIFTALYVVLFIIKAFSGDANSADLNESVAKVHEAVSALSATLAEIARAGLGS